MSKDKLTDALGGIGDDLILEAKKSRAGVLFLRRFVAASACLAILMGAFFMLLPKNEPDPTDPVLQNTTSSFSTSTSLATTKPTAELSTAAPTPDSTTQPATASSTAPGSCEPPEITTVVPTPSTTRPITSVPTSSTTVVPTPSTTRPITSVPTSSTTVVPTQLSSTKPTTARPITSTPTQSNTTGNPTHSTTAGTRPSSTTTVAPTTSGQQPAIPKLTIMDRAAYAEMFAAAEDQTIFAQNQALIRTFGNRDELKEFLTLLQSLPLPSIEGMKCTSLEYFPTFQRLALAYSADNGLSYGFMFDLDPAQVADTKKNLQRDDLINEQTWTVTGAEAFVTVTDLQVGLASNMGQHYYCWMEINGVWAYLSCSQAPQNLTLDAIIAPISIGNALYW